MHLAERIVEVPTQHFPELHTQKTASQAVKDKKNHFLDGEVDEYALKLCTVLYVHCNNQKYVANTLIV